MKKNKNEILNVEMDGEELDRSREDKEEVEMVDVGELRSERHVHEDVLKNTTTHACSDEHDSLDQTHSNEFESKNREYASGCSKMISDRSRPFSVVVAVLTGIAGVSLLAVIRRWRMTHHGRGATTQRNEEAKNRKSLRKDREKEELFSHIFVHRISSKDKPILSGGSAPVDDLGDGNVQAERGTGLLNGRLPDEKALSKVTLAISDRFDVAGFKTAFGCEKWAENQEISSMSAQVVDVLIAHGAVPKAILASWPLGCEPPFSDRLCWQNPLDCKRTHGGGEFGTAVAVAQGHAKLGVVVDEMASGLLPAAYCGLYAYRPTKGLLPTEGAAMLSPKLASTAFISRDPSDLFLAVKTISNMSKSPAVAEVVHYLVADDLFNLCGPELGNMTPAIVQAVRRWSGPDQAQAVSLCEWLYQRFPALQAFIDENVRMNGDGNANSPHSRSLNVLNALFLVAQTIHKNQFCQSKYIQWAEKMIQHSPREKTKATSPMPTAVIEAVARHDPMNDTKEGLDALNIQKDGDNASIYKALQVADELSKGMRAALSEGYIFVIPTTAGPAPQFDWNDRNKNIPSHTTKDQVRAQRQLAVRFAALSSLAGVPQMAIPLVVPDGPPLSISLVAMHRKDHMILRAALKLGPMLREESVKLMEVSNKALTENVNKGKKFNSESGGNIESSKISAAEGAKQIGNEAFRSGRYEDAIRRYSEAIYLNPKEAIYYSNRAMAHLKLGNYSDAEMDCDAALEIDNYLVKAWLRRGTARMAMGMLEEARSDYQRVLELEPNNKQAFDELSRLHGSSMLK